MEVVCIKENVNVSNVKLGEVYELISIKNNVAKLRLSESDVIIVPAILFNDMFEIK